MYTFFWLTRYFLSPYGSAHGALLMVSMLQILWNKVRDGEEINEFYDALHIDSKCYKVSASHWWRKCNMRRSLEGQNGFEQTYLFFLLLLNSTYARIIKTARATKPAATPAIRPTFNDLFVLMAMASRFAFPGTVVASDVLTKVLFWKCTKNQC